MHTVIILNKRSSELLQDYRFLFKPFIDEGLISFCGWNESGTDLKSSVPDLGNIIKGKKEWRAIVLNTDSVYDYMNSMVPSKQNPFDYSNVDSEDYPHESPIPIIRLTHILGGYNNKPTKVFEKGFEYFDKDGFVQRVMEKDLDDDELQRLSLEYDDIKSVYIEEEVPEEILSAQQELVEKYTFYDARPTEILLISTKKIVADNEHTRIKESWKNRLEMTSSAFWEKNKYPNNCRFMFFDVTNSDNSLYHKQLTEFWVSVLTVSVNRISASTLQAYRLYRLNVEISKSNLSKVLNEHINKLNSAHNFIKEQLNLRPEFTFDEDAEIISKQIVPVAIESNDRHDLYMDFSSVGLCRDCPEDELANWQKQVRKKKTNFEKYLKTPRRAIDKSATYLKAKAETFKGEQYELDQFQIADLKEYMLNLQGEIMSNDAKAVINRKQVLEKISEIDKKVKKEISYRLRTKTVLIIGTIALAICLGGFIPYIRFSVEKRIANFIPALLLSLVVVLFSALGGIVALFLQRRKVVKLMKGFNDVMRGVVNVIRTGANKFEEYFTNICTHLKAQSLLDGINNKQKTIHSKVSLFNMHRLALTSAIKRAEEWVASYSVERIDEVVPNVTVYFNVEVVPKNNSLYYFQPDLEEIDIPINSTGDMVLAPYKFVQKLWIEREEVYDETEGE